MFSYDHEGFDKDAQEVADRFDAELVEALELIGVYVQTSQTVGCDTPKGPKAGLFVVAQLGRMAFSDRVQRPEQEAFDAVFDEMTDSLVETEYEERRRALDD